MIVLKILLWLLLGILGIILLVLILPISAEASFIDEDLTYKVKFAFLPVIDSEKRDLYDLFKERKNKKEKIPEDEVDDDPEPDAEDESPDISADTAEKTSPEVTEETVSAEKDAEEETEDDIDLDFDSEFDEEFEAPKEKKKLFGKKKKADEPKEEPDISSKIDFAISLWEAADRPLLKILKGVKFSELYIDFIIANEDAYKCALNYGRISGFIFTSLGWLGAIFNVKLKTVDINPGFSLTKGRYDASVKVSFELITLVIAGIWFLLIYIFKIFIPNKLKFKK